MIISSVLLHPYIEVVNLYNKIQFESQHSCQISLSTGMICWHISTAGSQERVPVNPPLSVWPVMLFVEGMLLGAILWLLFKPRCVRSACGWRKPAARGVFYKARCIFSILKPQICKECKYSVTRMPIPFYESLSNYGVIFITEKYTRENVGFVAGTKVKLRCLIAVRSVWWIQECSWSSTNQAGVDFKSYLVIKISSQKCLQWMLFGMQSTACTSLQNSLLLPHCSKWVSSAMRKLREMSSISIRLLWPGGVAGTENVYGGCKLLRVQTQSDCVSRS